MNILDLKSISSNYLLCIDSDLECIKEVLEIDAKIIFVMLGKKNKIFWQIEGKIPIVKFSEQIEKVINGEKWVISTKNSSKIEFPNPTDNDFMSNHKFFRLESICVNGWCTEFLLQNNKFIDLIVYLNPSFGEINVNPEFKIVTITNDIRFKLFMNECTKTKKQAIVTYLSIRICKNIDEYLEKCNKTNISKEIKDALEKYIVKLPSIFQLLTNYNDFQNFCEDDLEKEKLIHYRNKLIYNYYRLIKELKPSILMDRDSKLCNAYESFKKFCKISLNLKDHEICPNNSKVLKRTILKLNSDLKKKINDFYGFFYALYFSEKKDLLFKYNVIGDIPCNSNFELFCGNNLSDYLNLSHINLGIGVGCLLAGTVLIFYPTPISWTVLILGVFFFILFCSETSLKEIFARNNSRYFKKVLILNPKTYSLDN